MKCPNCGFELEDGLLYCESCGKEIQIVPDFEPEIENSIIETLSTVAEEIGLDHKEKEAGFLEGTIFQENETSKNETLKNETSKNDENNRSSGRVRHQETNETLREERQAKNGLIISIISFIGVILLAVVIGIQMYQVYSVPYQIDRATAYLNEGNYAKAVEYMAKADELLPNNADIKYALASYHYLNQEPDKATGILIPMTQSDRYTVEEKERCYIRIITIFDEQQKYQEISDLLKNCEEESLVTQFQSYLALEPEFSVAEGNYAEIIPLKLSSNTSGKIYYTLNGSKPTRSSRVYTSPIFMQTGDYVVSAMFVNDYGIESEIVSNSYHIDLLVPDPPVVALYTGLYVEPTWIEVTAPSGGDIYYTTNGNDPTIDSSHYTGPVSMPLGRTEFRFVVISEEGVSSEVISRSFEFRLMTNVSVSDAIRNLMHAMVRRRVLIDISGKAFGTSGYYEYRFDTLIEIPDKGLYYKIDEYYGEDEGEKEKTDHLYAIEVYEGSPNRLIYDEMGEMGLISLED